MAYIQATGHAFSNQDIFINFPNKKLKITCNECEELIGERHREKLAEKIFRDCFKMVIEDVIDNNVTFQLPLTGIVKSDIHMATFKDDAFKAGRKNGKWKNVDFLKSLFTGHQLRLFMYSPNRLSKSKPIYVNKELKDRIDQNTNLGKTYC